MKKVILNGHSVVVFESIDEMPIVNYSRYNKYMLIDSGIGSNLEDVDIHIERIVKYIQNKSDLAIQELMNMRQALYFINQEVSPKNLAFAALIAEVDGVKIENTSDDILTELLSKLNGAKESDITSLLEDIKKKVEFELSAYFPEISGSPEEKEAYDKLKQRTQLILDSIMDDTIDNTDAIKVIDIFFLTLSKPKSFSGSTNTEVQYVKDFEKACILISQETGLHPKTMSVLQFYVALEQIKKSAQQNKPKSSHGK
jgi:hypothetical protein